MTPEGKIKLEICQYLEKLGFVFWVNSAPGRRGRKANSKYSSVGVSDVCGLLRSGKFFAIEVKAGKNPPSPEQLDFLERVRLSGGIGIVAYSVDDVISLTSQ